MAHNPKKELIRSKGRVRGGVRVPHYKNTADCATVDLPVPGQVTIAMQQHIGRPCIPCVKKGDRVLVGDRVGDCTDGMCVPVHTGVSGQVTGITELLLPNGQSCQAVQIEADGQQTVSDAVCPPVVENREMFLQAVKDAGLVGLGGAGFPAYVKLDPGKPVDTLVVNAAECEPYITCDNREILENAKKSYQGRYTCINLTNRNTIEFRIFRGTLKYNTLIATLQFVERLCSVAIVLSEEELQALSWSDLMLGIQDSQYPELVKYLKERRLYINEPVTAEGEV